MRVHDVGGIHLRSVDLMPRSLEQNKIFHRWCRDIAKHLSDNGVNTASETMVKELVKMLLGNTTVFLDTKIAMPTSKYKLTENDLTIPELKNGFISMDQLLTKMQAWASTDLNLELKSINEDGDNR